MFRSVGTRFLAPCVRNGFVQVRKLHGLSVGVCKETLENEARVALVPAHVTKIIKKGGAVVVEKDAGLLSGFTDAQYIAAGATIAASADAIWKNELVVKVFQLLFLAAFEFLSSVAR